ncbi:unnamed protein product [Symbiodinium natans]|uniref:AMP-dependent synthetase/ligase domain-containing protein n=1 Tax=Symbiodinium natans TaxID=878477 RepID=A0A812K8M0_9DINO|nr:unnamed protein product [Symbiodinium natans]
MDERFDGFGALGFFILWSLDVPPTVNSCSTTSSLTEVACSPEPAHPLTATVSDRPTPIRRTTPHKRRTRSSLASAITATQPEVVSPVATEIDSDAESAARSRSRDPRQSQEPPQLANVPDDDLLVMLEVPDPPPSVGVSAATDVDKTTAAAAPDDRAAAAAAAARFAAEVSGSLHLYYAGPQGAPQGAPAAAAEEEEEDFTWVTGGVVRPLERLMFGESPHRLSRGSRILGALLDTPPDLVEDSPGAPSKARPSKKAKAKPNPSAANGSRDTVPAPLNPPERRTQPTPLRQESRLEAPSRPISVNDLRRAAESTWSSPGRPRSRIERRAIWFLEQPGPPGCDTELSRVAVDEEAFLDAALEAALEELRKRGVSRGGPAAAAQLLHNFGQAVGATTAGLRCVPLDGDLHRCLPAELLGDPRVSGARLPGRSSGKRGGPALAGAALHRAKDVVRQILDSMSPVVFKIGITCTPLMRFRAYDREGYQQMHLLHVTEEPGLVQMLEAALISEFQERPGCRNVARGGEGPVGRAPYFAYLVVVACGDGVGILQKRDCMQERSQPKVRPRHGAKIGAATGMPSTGGNAILMGWFGVGSSGSEVIMEKAIIMEVGPEGIRYALVGALLVTLGRAQLCPDGVCRSAAEAQAASILQKDSRVQRLVAEPGQVTSQEAAGSQPAIASEPVQWWHWIAFVVVVTLGALINSLPSSLMERLLPSWASTSDKAGSHDSIQEGAVGQRSADLLLENSHLLDPSTDPEPAESLLGLLPLSDDVAVCRDGVDAQPVTYAQLRQQLEDPAFASFLRPSDRVALVLENGKDMAMCLLAVMHHACAVPLNPTFTEAELAQSFEQLRVTVVLTGAGSCGDAAHKAAAQLQLRVLTLEKVSRSSSSTASPQLCLSGPQPPLEDVEGRGLGARAEAPSPDPERTVLLLKTSGTTSRGKVVPFSLRRLSLAARLNARGLELAPGDVCLSMMPLYHIAGISVNFLASMSAGATILFYSGQFEVTRFVAELEREGHLRPSWYFAVPAVHEAVLRHVAELGRPVQHRLKLIRSAGAALAQQSGQKLIEAFHCAVTPAYGMTEALEITCPPANYDFSKPCFVAAGVQPQASRLTECGNLNSSVACVAKINLFEVWSCCLVLDLDAFAEFRVSVRGGASFLKRKVRSLRAGKEAPQQPEGGGPEQERLHGELLKVRHLMAHGLLSIYAALCSLMVTANHANVSLNGPQLYLTNQGSWLFIAALAVLSLYAFLPRSMLKVSTLNAWFAFFVIFCLCFAAPGTLPAFRIQDSLILAVVFRLPVTVVATRTLWVALGNVPVSVLIVWRFGSSPAAQAAGNSLPVIFVMALEAAICTLAACISSGMSELMRQRASLRCENNKISSDNSAISALLRLMSDAVIELDQDLRMIRHSPELSAMLLRDRPGASTEGLAFTDFIHAADAARAAELLLNPICVGTGAHAFHTRLVDTFSNKVCVEIFAVMTETSEGEVRHLLGLRDFTDSPSLSGERATDAMEATVCGSMSVASFSGEEKLSCSDVISPTQSWAPEEWSRATPVKKQAFLDLDMEVKVIASASPSVSFAAGLSLDDFFPSPHTTQLMQQVCDEAQRGLESDGSIPNKVFNFEDLPVRWTSSKYGSLVGAFQVVRTRFGGLGVLLAFEDPDWSQLHTNSRASGKPAQSRALKKHRSSTHAAGTPGRSQQNTRTPL